MKVGHVVLVMLRPCVLSLAPASHLIDIQTVFVLSVLTTEIDCESWTSRRLMKHRWQHWDERSAC